MQVPQSVRQHGQCLCGGLRYEVTAAPTDLINCHCRFCQRATGSSHLAEMLFDKAAFRISDGVPTTYDHVSAGSGKVIHIHFCATCGTKTHMTFERFPEIVGVFSGTLNDPSHFKRTPENTLYFFLGTAPDGVVLPAGHNIYHAHYWASEGVASTPQVFDEPKVVTPELRAASARFSMDNDGV